MLFNLMYHNKLLLRFVLGNKDFVLPMYVVRVFFSLLENNES